MGYDNLHNITSKKQDVTQTGVSFMGTLKAGYDLAYNYAKPHQLGSIEDASYRTENTEAKELQKKNNKYTYDANGNLIYVNTERYKKDGTHDSTGNERKLLWDEENRLEAVSDNGYVSNYWYDAAGERTVKTSGEGEGIYVLGQFSGGRTQTADFTLYVNPYIVVSKGGRYTKHIYIGSQRIVSKLGDLGSYGADPRRIEYAGANTSVGAIDYKAKYTTEQNIIKARYDTLKVPYYGKNNDDYVNGKGFCCDEDGSQTGGIASGGGGGNITNGNDNPEKYQYYYHSDHLGSSSYITNLDGEVAQHIEYVPFGEVFIEERNNTWNTPYKFNGKELDEETGLYYYGARYMDPRTSLWISSDPLREKYAGVSSYAYCFNNPVILIDPDGMAPTDIVIVGDASYRQKAFNDLQKLSSKQLVLLDNGLVIEANKVGKGDKIELTGKVETSKKGAAIYKPIGTALVRDLIYADKDVIITDSPDGQNRTKPEDIDYGQNGIGTASIVEYNPNNRQDGKDGTLPIVNENGTVGAPAFVTLGHELGHAQDLKNGKNDKNIDPTKTDPDSKEKGVLSNGEIKARKRENQIRIENRIVKRKLPY